MCKSRSFLHWVFTPTTTVIFIPLDLNLAVYRQQPMVGWGVGGGRLYDLFSQDTMPLTPLSHLLSPSPLDLHPSNYPHFPIFLHPLIKQFIFSFKVRTIKITSLHHMAKPHFSRKTPVFHIIKEKDNLKEYCFTSGNAGFPFLKMW